MILISFSSAEDANVVKKEEDIFNSHGTENLPFRFFLGHPVYPSIYHTARKKRPD